MAENIRELRQHLGLRQCAIAKETNMDAEKLSRIERGWIDAKPSEIARIKEAISRLTKGSK